VTGPAALVWFKRNLRVRDHAPLAQALHFERALAVVVIEPQWLQSPECDPRHVGFLLDCVARLQCDLAARGLALRVLTGAMPRVLQSLHGEFPFTHRFSHEETGPGWSYARDLAVARWCRHQGVNWAESPQTGVVRRLRSRTGWAGRWAQRMNAPEASEAQGFRAAPGLRSDFLPTLPTLPELGLPALGAPLPPGGESAAWATLESFLGGRARGYRSAMSTARSLLRMDAAG
jgi:deoxyribodipyrimidine photo-lyase